MFGSSHSHSHSMSSDMQECMDACHQCHMSCLRMAATHCLEMGGRHVEPQHMRLMLDCAEICQTAMNFMLRDSAHHAAICAACARVCRACAASCQEVGDMQECVEACLRCADSCERMASMAA